MTPTALLVSCRSYQSIDAMPEVTAPAWTSYAGEARRMIAVAVVIVGTLLNGYGPFIARTLHLRGP